MVLRKPSVDVTAQPKVAIVHDWLLGGGAELVVEQLHQMYPDAPIYTSYCTNEWRERLDNKVVTGWLQLWPFSSLRKYIPMLRIWWFTHLDLEKYELVIAARCRSKGHQSRKTASILTTVTRQPTTTGAVMTNTCARQALASLTHWRALGSSYWLVRSGAGISRRRSDRIL